MTAELVARYAGGSLDLMGWNDSPHGEYQIETLAEGTNWGSPESTRRTLRTAMVDGARSTKDRDNNRTIPLKLRVSSSSYAALAYGEQQLDMLDGQRCELVWTPPARLGVAPTVFVADYLDLAHAPGQDWDLGYETGELEYTLTVSALPHAYADTWVTMPALVLTPSTPVSVDTCDAVTGWTATSATLSASSGTIAVTPDGDVTAMSATRTGAVDFTTDRYLGVRKSRPTRVEALNGERWAILPAAGMDGNYFLYDTDVLADKTVDALRFVYEGPPSGTFGAKGNLIDAPRYLSDIRKQATPRATTGRGQLRVVDVPGSRRTPASLLVQSPTAGLQTVLVYAGPKYNPGLTRGAMEARFTSTASLSGTTSTLASGATLSFEVPASDFYPGSHSLWVDLLASGSPYNTSGTLTLKTKLQMGSGPDVSTGGTATVMSVQTCTKHLALTSQQRAVVLLGAADLPGAALPQDTTAIVRVELSWAKDAPLTNEQPLGILEVLAFNRTLGRPVVAEVGSERKLWIDSANLAVDHDAAYVGSAGKSQSVPLSLASSLPAWTGAITMLPGTTYLYVGTTGASDATVEATFRPAGNTHMPVMVD